MGQYQYTPNHSNFDSAFSIPENFDLYSPLALAVLPGASHYHVYIGINYYILKRAVFFDYILYRNSYLFNVFFSQNTSHTVTDDTH
jgi:hypothetical protein